MKKIKVALAGIGGMGNVHFNCYKKIKNAELVAVCDVRKDFALERVGSACPVYTDIDEMLKNEEIDVVDICTPSYLHAEMAVECLNKGLNVLCEKPMTLTCRDAEKVLAAAENSGKKFMVAHVVRFMPQYAFLKKVTDEGKLGKLISLDMRRLSSVPRWSWENWMQDEQKSGGVCLDLSVHDIDFVQSVLGMPERVSASYRPLKSDSSFIKSTLYYGETAVSVQAAWYNAEIPFTADFLAVFDNGFVEFKDGKLFMCDKEIPLDGDGSGDFDSGINVKGGDAYENEISYFIDCVINDKKPLFVMPESSANSITLASKIIAEAVKI